ncbi:unnamed protein product [Coffea canephora]|uniref:Glutaredoxin domain-containing protein n=2 Tax=Coffea TaxID=13442 RepID=A0A068TVV6_COFCA|nr:glutaredoxin-C9-like [Coffea arabica]CDO99478.1 unnamed protein product [Coffea canephora]
MQQATPYTTWPPTTATSAGGSTSLESQLSDSSKSAENDGMTSSTSQVTRLVSENAVIAFGRRGCCMCYVVKQLLLGLGVNPTIFYVDEEDEGAIIDELSKIAGVLEGDGNGKVQFPAVFVGGKLFGGLERVMATHITGELVPMLREARALWL